MAVPEQTPFIEYTANGTTTVFPLPFQCDKAEYLIVNLDGNEAPVGSWSFVNGSVTFNTAPANGVVVNIERNTPFQRTTDYQSYNNSFRPAPVNKDFDLIWWKLQELGYRDQVIWLALVKEISGRIDGDENLQNQINTIDEWLDNLQQNVDENTRDIAQLVNDLSKEIADRITGDKILKDMFLSMIDEAINEGTINALAITHLDSLEALEGVTNVWDGRTIYVKDLGNYRYDALTTSWVKAYQDADNVKDGAENQKEINDKNIRVFESLSDLLDYTPRKNGQTVFLKSIHLGLSKGGGHFVFHSGSTKNDGGIFFATATGSWHRITLETWRNVQWYGAKGNGVDDDFLAIKKAVDSFGDNSADFTGPRPPHSSFATIYFPASEGSYIISDTIYMSPYLRLKGDSTRGGSIYWNSDGPMSVIETKFTESYKWAIETRNVIRSTGKQQAWNIYLPGTDYESGIVSGCFGVYVEDIVVRNKNTSTPVYGGIKFANSPQCSIDKCFIDGFDVGVLSSGSWDAVFNCGTQSYKCGMAFFGDMNGLQFNGYQHVLKDRTPMEQQLGIFDHDSTSGIPDITGKTFGVKLDYAYGYTSNSLIAEYHDYGIYASGSIGSIANMYSEGCGTGIAVVGGKLQVQSIAGIANKYTVAVGDGAAVTIHSCVDDSYTTSFYYMSNWSEELNIPININASLLNPKVNLLNGSREVIYVDQVNGKDSNSGISQEYALKTISAAIKLASVTQEGSKWNNGYFANNRRARTIVLMSSGSYETSLWQELIGIDLTIKPLNSSVNATIVFSEKTWLLINSKVQFDRVSVTRPFQNSWQNSQGAVRCDGDCEIFVKQSVLTLGYPLVSVSAENGAFVDLKILNCSGAISDSGVFYQTSSGNAGCNAFIRFNETTSTNIVGSVNKGVVGISGSYENKNVSAII
ncbi:hypothetical protein NYZ01_14250 [Acinetobacter baumannii]|nr:hypothetical protein [Acinetobacter baumannii]